jgi:hypothetical protein
MTTEIFVSWPVAIVGAALLLAGSYTYAMWRVSRLDRTLERVASEMAGQGILVDPATFIVTDPRHIVVITTRDLAIVDAQRGRLVQRLSHAEVRGLRIAEGGQHIAFSFVLDGGAESRTIVTRSIAEFGRLFQLIAAQGKTLDFIPEKVA